MKSLIIDDDVVEHRSFDGTIHQQLFGAEHLRNLGQQHAAADRRHAIGDAAEQCVGADAAESVRPAALVAEHEVRRAALRASIATHSLDELRNRARSLLELVDHVLRVEERDAIAVDWTGETHQLVELIVLAAEAEDQHAAGIGMAHQAGEDMLRVL